jgi:hypothetical protein
MALTTTLTTALLTFVLPWNEEVAQHLPTALDAGKVMRVRKSNGWYQIEVQEGEGWRVHLRTLRRSVVDRVVAEYCG